MDRYGALLFSYLAKEPFRYHASAVSTRKVFEEQENTLLATMAPHSNSFLGNVFILVNGLSFSTTADFCAIARSNRRAVFIGEETGGGYYGNTSGQTMKIELPNSQIQVIIPRFKYENDVEPTKHSDRGVIPDYIVVPEVAEYLSGTDVQLKFALDLTAPKNK